MLANPSSFLKMVAKIGKKGHSTDMKRSVLLSILFFSVVFSLAAQEKKDALKLFRNGRDLEAIGRTEDAKIAYSESIEVCKQDLVDNPRNMDAYTIYSWALFRLGKYQESVNICLEALKLVNDSRIIESLAEGYFFLGNYKDSLKFMEKYIDAAPRGERLSTAHFFVGEIYRINKQYNRADIAYTAAVHLEPGISLWWYRLATVRENVGDKSGAQQAYERALKLRPDYKDARDGLGRVRT